MMKKIILTIGLLTTLVFGGAFVMKKGEPLIKKSFDNEKPLILSQPNKESISRGCTKTYKKIIYADTESEIEQAVSNASISTKIIVEEGIYKSNMTLNGNSAHICIESKKHLAAKIQSEVKIDGNNITISGFMFNGKNGYIYVGKKGGSTRITNNMWNDSKAKNWIKSMSGYKTTVDFNTFKNKLNNSSIDRGIALVLRSYSNIQTPSQHNIHHNYFKNFSKGQNTNIYETIQVSTYKENTVLGLDYKEHAPYTLGPNDNIKIEYNLLEDTNGEAENISIKSKGVHILHNTFRNCKGTLSLRSGSNSVVANNYFFGRITGTNKSDGGIIIHGDNHEIHHNYIKNMVNKYAAIEPLNGGESQFGWWKPSTNHNIHNNYITDSKWGIRYGRTMPTYRGSTSGNTSGKLKNNIFIRTETGIYYSNKFVPNEVSISENKESISDTLWDMSGVLTVDDVKSGKIGAGL